MAATNFRVMFTESAWSDLEEIVAFWAGRGEPERGVQYAHDLPSEAIRLLADPGKARAGRFLRQTSFPQAQELAVFSRSYRILYLVDEAEAAVVILRFWHGHRDEPFRG